MTDTTDANQAGGDQAISPSPSSHPTNRATPRALRMAQPLAREVVEEIAKQYDVCIRPIALRPLDTYTGKVETIDVPCGATLESKCPPCAKRNRQLRMAQCREGWHLDHEPVNTPDEADDYQRYLVELRADAQAWRDEAEKAGEDTTDLDAAIGDLDDEINRTGMRGTVLGRTTASPGRGGIVADRKPNGRSSIYLGNDGYWHGWVTIGIKPDGSPDRRHRMAKTEAEVTRRVRELEGKREAGHVSKPGRIPNVTEWITEYLDVICDRLVASGKMAPRTLEDYRSKTRHWIIPLLGRHRLDRLAPEHLDKAYAMMLDQGLSSSTVLKVHRILSRALKIAMRRGKVTKNVATLIDAPVAADPDLAPLTRNEARKILEAAKPRRNAARWSVALALGIRQGEALGLRWSFVDLETGVIKAWYQAQRSPWRHGCDDLQECGKEWHRWPCKPRCRTHKHDPKCPQDCKKRGHVCPTRTCPKGCTGHADRCPRRTRGCIVFRQRKGPSRLTLQCPPELLPILREHKKLQDAERADAGDLWGDHDLLFPTRRGRPMEHSEDYKMWKALLKQAGVREARLHDARHTAGTLLVEQGVHIRVAQEILGHARVTTTERYTHVAGALVQDASERMGAALWGES